MYKHVNKKASIERVHPEGRQLSYETAEKINELNSQLLAQAIELAEFDITLFKSMRQAPETANYDRNAYNTGDILGSSGFDAKQ